jgi:eukaryotic-like serine/threonine-protein kinase
MFMTLPNRALTLQPGEILESRYQIVSKLGEGGMGSVYLALDLRLSGKLWAMKLLEDVDEQSGSSAAEAEMLIRLQHPQLPHIVDYFMMPDRQIACVVMDYVAGTTLQDVFEQNKRSIPIEQLMQYAKQLCDLLVYLHNQAPQPIIYRDLKPSNVIVDPGGTVRLIDFGIARQFKTGQYADTIKIGTVGFAAPEQYTDAQSDARSDLYSLGALMYYFLSGGFFYYLSQKPLSYYKTDIPQLLSHLVWQLLQDNPNDRIQTAEEVSEKLKHLLFLTPSNPPFHEGNQAKKLSIEPISHKLIVIGSLYAGAGSTFTAITAARMLHLADIPHALVEHPLGNPDLYMLLLGEKNAPKSYVFLSEEVLSEKNNTISGQTAQLDSKAWRTGRTTWVPVHPDGFKHNWEVEDAFKMLYKAKSPVVLWDISTNWEDETAKAICKSADDIWVITDTSPAKVNRPSSRIRINMLEQHYGSKVKWIVNRDSPASGRSNWFQSLPKASAARLPEIVYEQVLHAMREGTFVQEEPDLRKKLLESFSPLLKSISPQLWSKAIKAEKKPRRTFFYLFNR